MTRLAVLLTALGTAAITTLTPALAANPSGAIEATWTVGNNHALSVATQYATSSANILTAQGTSTPSLQPSTAGVCSGTGTSETAYNLTFGALVASVSSEVGCNYQNAVAAEVQTNDTNGYSLNEFVVSVPSGVTFCAFPNGATNGTATSTVASTQSTAPAAYSGTACANGGTVLASGTSPSGTNPGDKFPIAGGVTASNVVLGTAPSSGNFAWGSSGGATVGSFFSEDMQINLAPGQATASAQSGFIVFQLISN